jgi:Sec-independent protein translocase protein TatA
MEIFGIGPLEFIFILLIALIVLGPNDMVKASRTLGRVLRKIVTSSEWRTVQRASKEFRYLPNKLIREAGIEDLKDELSDKNLIGGQLGIDKLKKDFDKWQKDISTWTTPPDQPEKDQGKIIVNKQDSENEQNVNPENPEPK